VIEARVRKSVATSIPPNSCSVFSVLSVYSVVNLPARTTEYTEYTEKNDNREETDREFNSPLPQTRRFS
jgi:hypothetical protein